MSRCRVRLAPTATKTGCRAVLDARRQFRVRANHRDPESIEARHPRPFSRQRTGNCLAAGTQDFDNDQGVPPTTDDEHSAGTACHDPRP